MPPATPPRPPGRPSTGNSPASRSPAGNSPGSPNSPPKSNFAWLNTKLEYITDVAGHAFEVRKSWRPDTTDPNPNLNSVPFGSPPLQLRMGIDKDEVGKVLQYHVPNQWRDAEGRIKVQYQAWCFVAVVAKGRPTRKGWVPRTVLTINKAIYGKPTFVGEFAKIDVGVGASIKAPSGNDSVVATTMRGLSIALRDCGDISVASEIKIMLDNPQSLNNALGIMIQGIKNAGMWQVLHKKNFTFEDLKAAGSPMKNGPGRFGDQNRGIYLIFYYEGRLQQGSAQRIKSDKHLYAGRTEQTFQERDKGHLEKTKADSTSNHHKIAFKHDLQSGRHMTPFMLLPQGTANAVISLAEQLTTSMMDTMLPVMKGNRVRGETFDEDLEPTEVLEKAARRLDQIHEGSLIYHLARKVFQKTGWQGTYARPSFNAPNGYGLNWDSPCSTPGSTPVGWVRLDAVTRQLYTRRDLTVQKVGGSSKATQVPMIFLFGKDGRKSFTLPKECADLVGKKVWVTVEIATNGRPHPYQYARLPTFQTYQDQLAASQVAIRVEHNHDDEGRWESIYLQNKQVYSQDPDFAFIAYDAAIGLRYHLERIPIVNAPSWFKRDVGIASDVRLLGFNPVRQEYTLHQLNVQAPRTPGQIVNPLSNIPKLQELGLHNINVPWVNPGSPISKAITPPRPPGTPVGAYRKRCDTCQYFKKSCEQHGNTNHCVLCHTLARPCSWTNTVLISNGEKLPRGALIDRLDAAWAGPEFKSTIVNIDNPQITQTRA